MQKFIQGIHQLQRSTIPLEARNDERRGVSPPVWFYRRGDAAPLAGCDNGM